MLESSLTPVVVFVVLWLMPIMVFPVFYALLLLLCFLEVDGQPCYYGCPTVLR